LQGREKKKKRKGEGGEGHCRKGPHQLSLRSRRPGDHWGSVTEKEKKKKKGRKAELTSKFHSFSSFYFLFSKGIQRSWLSREKKRKVKKKKGGGDGFVKVVSSRSITSFTLYI